MNRIYYAISPSKLVMNSKDTSTLIKFLMSTVSVTCGKQGTGMNSLVNRKSYNNGR